MTAPPRLNQPTAKIVIALLVALAAAGAIAWALLSGGDSSPPANNNPAVAEAPDEEERRPPALNITADENQNKDPKFVTYDPPADDSPIFSESSDSSSNDDSSSSVPAETVVEEQIDIIEDDSSAASKPGAPLTPALSGGPRGATLTRSPQFRVTNRQSGAKLFCSLNNPRLAKARECGATVKFRNLKSGRYLLRVWQQKAGKRSAPAKRRFTVLPPKPARPTLRSAPAAYTSQETVTFTFAQKARQYQCSLVLGSQKPRPRACSSPQRYGPLAEGRHVFRLWAINQRGRSPVRKYVFTVQRQTPPAPTILSGPPEGSPAGLATFTFRGQSGSTFSCQINDGEFAACRSPQTYQLGPGEYRFAVKQRDRAGNLSPAAEREFTLAPAFDLQTSVAGQGSRLAARGYATADPPEDGGYILAPEETSENSTLTLNVLAAVELSTPANDTKSQAPTAALNTDNTLSNIVTFGQAANIRSNLSWSVAVTGDTGFTNSGANGAPISTSSGNISKGSGSAGNRNSTNATQDAGTQSTQAVSWADEAGVYTASQTHTATQSLPAGP
jgi:hypothetical protein